MDIKHREKFLIALADQYMSTISDSDKIAYANRVMKYEHINSIRDYGIKCLSKEISKRCPHLINEWDKTVQTYGDQ